MGVRLSWSALDYCRRGDPAEVANDPPSGLHDRDHVMNWQGFAPRLPPAVLSSRSARAVAPPAPPREAPQVGADPLLDDLTPFGEDVDLAFPLVHVMVHGWPLPFCGVDRAVLLWGSICHHVKREASQLHPIYAHSAARYFLLQLAES